jgi:hypothetical protein
MITRRCTQRRFLLRPDRETNNAFTYCLNRSRTAVPVGSRHVAQVARLVGELDLLRRAREFRRMLDLELLAALLRTDLSPVTSTTIAATASHQVLSR